MSTLDLPPATVVAGRFRIERRLGAGGMGAVFEATEPQLGRKVALKLLRDGREADMTQLARFEREARAAARLDHPNIVGVTELLRDRELGPVIVMERLTGRSLAAHIEASGALSEAEVVEIGLQALDALAVAHAAGMVHRDLKPSNVFLVPVGRGVLVKLLDFGIVKLVEEGGMPKLTQRGALIGTPAYMSPEQVRCDPIDARSDLYSLGACLHEALVGRPPYVAAHTLELIAAVGRGPPRDLADLRPGISHALANVVRVAMARTREVRFESAAAMRAALASAELSGASRPPPRTTTPPNDTNATEDARPAAPATRTGTMLGIGGQATAAPEPTAPRLARPVHAASPPGAPAPGAPAPSAPEVRPPVPARDPTPTPRVPLRRPAPLFVIALVVSAIALGGLWWRVRASSSPAVASLPASAVVPATAASLVAPSSASRPPPTQVEPMPSAATPTATMPTPSALPAPTPAAPPPAHRPASGPHDAVRPAPHHPTTPAPPPPSMPDEHRSVIGQELMDPFGR